MQRRTFIQAALGSAALAGTPSALWAQGNKDWPTRSVTWILSQPPGSGPDNIARLMGERIGKKTGQSFVIENKPGGQNIIGAQAAARAKPDGYTFYFATTAALVTNSYLFKTMPYDPAKDFVPVAFVAKSPFAVLVKNDSPFKTMQELVAASKAQGGKFSLATEGPRTFGGIIARLMNVRTKMQANLVSYSSTGVSIQDLMGGHVEAAVADVASTAQLVRQGRLRMLAVTSAKRLPGWDNVPALSESLPDFEMVGWFGVVAPAGTPADAVQGMNQQIDAQLKDPEVAERMLTIGPIAEPMGGPEQFAAFLKQERQRWEVVSKEIGLLPE